MKAKEASLLKVVGEAILAHIAATGTTGVYNVTVAFSHLDPVVTELNIGDETLGTTPEYLFYVLPCG